MYPLSIMYPLYHTSMYPFFPNFMPPNTKSICECMWGHGEPTGGHLLHSKSDSLFLPQQPKLPRAPLCFMLDFLTGLISCWACAGNHGVCEFTKASLPLIQPLHSFSPLFHNAP